MMEETTGQEATPTGTYVANLPLSPEQIGALVGAGADLIGLPMKWAAGVDRIGIADEFRSFKEGLANKTEFTAVGSVPAELEAWARAAYNKKR